MEGYAYSYRKLAELYKAENDTASVETHITGKLKTVKIILNFYYARGMMYYDESDFGFTIADMKKAIDGNICYRNYAYYMLGSSYYMLHNYDKAYEYYQLAKDNGYSEILADK